MMVREPPPLRIRPRLEVGDRAAHKTGNNCFQDMHDLGARPEGRQGKHEEPHGGPHCLES